MSFTQEAVSEARPEHAPHFWIKDKLASHQSHLRLALQTLVPWPACACMHPPVPARKALAEAQILCPQHCHESWTWCMAFNPDSPANMQPRIPQRCSCLSTSSSGMVSSPLMPDTQKMEKQDSKTVLVLSLCQQTRNKHHRTGDKWKSELRLKPGRASTADNPPKNVSSLEPESVKCMSACQNQIGCSCSTVR